MQSRTTLSACGDDLYAANGKIIEIFWLAEGVQFELRGFELDPNFVVVDDDDLRVDLTAQKVIERAPTRSLWSHAHAHVNSETLNLSVAQNVVSQLFSFNELLVTTLTFCLRNVTPERIRKNLVNSAEGVATIEKTGFLYVSQGNLTSNLQLLKNGFFPATSAPVVLVHQAITPFAHEQKTEQQRVNELSKHVPVSCL